MYRKPGKNRMINFFLVMLGVVLALVITGGKEAASAGTLGQAESGGGTLLADAADMHVQFTVSQKLIAKDVKAEDASFSYTLTAETEGAPLPGGADGSYSFAMQKDDSRDLQLAFTGEGEYIYKLVCTGYDSGNFRTDTAEYTIKAFVYGNYGTVGADVLIIDADGNKREEALFKHVKLNDFDEPEVDPIVAVDPPVKKNITGTPKQADEFRFRLRAEEAGNPMPEGSSNGEKIITVHGAGTEEFGTWEYSVTGTYNYNIAEINTGNPDYEYDTKMFTITDVVTLENGEFQVSRTIVDSSGRQVASTLITPDTGNERAVSVEFTNDYVGDGGGADPTTTTGGGQDPTPGDNPTDSGGSPSERGTGDNPGGADGSDQDGGSSSRRATNPDTGDRNRMIALIVVCVSAGVALLITVILLGKKRRKKEE